MCDDVVDGTKPRIDRMHKVCKRLGGAAGAVAECMGRAAMSPTQVLVVSCQLRTSFFKGCSGLEARKEDRRSTTLYHYDA